MGRNFSSVVNPRKMEKIVVLEKSDQGNFGFSLLGKAAGFDHVIYDILENSPAAESGEVEAGDVIVKVNGTDVHRYSTKEVLKCLRLSADPVTLELKRDPKIKDHVRKYLSTNNNSNHHNNHQLDLSYSNSITSPTSPIINTNSINRGHRISSSDSSACRKSRIPVNNSRIPSSAPQSPQTIKPRYQSHIPTTANTTTTPTSTTNGSVLQQNNKELQQQQQRPPNQPRFEAFMMTGDLILNLSRTAQSSGLLPAQTKKVDSLRDSPIRSLKRKNGTAPQAKYDTSDSSPSISEEQNTTINSNTSDSMKNSYNNSNENNNRSVNKSVSNTSSKLSKIATATSDKTIMSMLKQVHHDGGSSSLDEDEEALVMSENGSSSSHQKIVKSEKSKLKMLNSSRNALSSSSSSNSLPNNNYDDGGGGGGGVSGSTNDVIDCHQVTEERSTRSHTRKLQQTNQYTVLNNEEYQHQVLTVTEERKLQTVSVTPSASMSSTTSTTSSASTTINRSETLLTPTPDLSYSVPTSPTSLSTPLLDAARRKELASSVPTSPETGQQDLLRRNSGNSQQQNGMCVRKNDASGFRTSRSEDHLQNSQRDGGLGSVVPIDIDEDVNSSLNTLLDTRHDSEDSQGSDRDRIVWTYNAPVPTNIPGQHPMGIISPTSHSSSISTSPQHTDSPASPTSVSSSVMSSSGSKGNGLSSHTANGGMNNLMFTVSGDHSVSEAISNISSPDYQDEHDLLSTRDLSAAMAISDPSDSDSTLLVDETTHKVQEREHKVVIQVRGGEKSMDQRDAEDELAALSEEHQNIFLSAQDCGREGSPPISDDGSDVESLHSFHYSPKAVDIPSAVRLAKRLYSLDGFKKSDVSRHLSKNNEFSRVVADEYLKYFLFERMTLDESLRMFLKQFSLSGETQERERVLVHFSKRFLDCNPGTFNSQDAVHTLTCAIMLLNTDLHGQNIGRKMTCSEFIDNLSELNDGENFPKDVLKHLYQAIKGHPLEWAVDDESPDPKALVGSLQGPPVGPNPFLDIPQNVTAVEYKKGYVMRKCCYDSQNKKTPFGKRSWKMFYCTLRDLVLYLHKDERGFHKNQLSDNVHNAIRIHHSLATTASDYTKKQHVFRLQTSDQSEYLFQTSDSKELQSWIDTINFVCASFSAPPLEGGVGSQKRFQRPLLPCSQTKLLIREQLASHEEQVSKLEDTVADHKRGSVPTKGLALQNYREKEAYLQYELKRYKTYVYLLSSHMNSNNPADIINIIIGATTTPTALLPSVIISGGITNIVAEDEELKTQLPSPLSSGVTTPICEQPQQHHSTNRKEIKNLFKS